MSDKGIPNPDYSVATPLLEVPTAQDEEACKDNHQESNAHGPEIHNTLVRPLSPLGCHSFQHKCVEEHELYTYNCV